MAGNTISFSLNDTMRGKVRAVQRRRKRTAISIDLFCKQLLIEKLNDIENARANMAKKLEKREQEGEFVTLDEADKMLHGNEKDED
jgi:hypothetical protein